MTIEKSLERIATALEIIIGGGATMTGGGGSTIIGKAPAKGKGKKKETPPPEPDDLDGSDDNLSVEKEFTEDDLMDQLREVIRLGKKPAGPNAAKKLLKKFDAGRVSEVKPADAATFHAECLILIKGFEDA